MAIKIIRVKAKVAEPAIRLEPTADEKGSKVWDGDRYLGRIVQVKMTGGWLAYPPRYLVERSETEQGAIAYLVKHKDKA